MADMTIRPSTKMLVVAAVLETILVLAVAFVALTYDTRLWVLLAIPLILSVMSAVRFAKKRANVIYVTDGKLRYEAGIASKTTRTLELEKIQDVRVDQTLGQRMLGLGSITIVTASETGSLTLDEIDGPQQAADGILNLARARKRNF